MPRNNQFSVFYPAKNLPKFLKNLPKKQNLLSHLVQQLLQIKGREQSI